MSLETIIASLGLQSGDILIANATADLAPADRIRIAADIKAAGVTNTVLVMQAEPTFEVIRASQ